MKKKLFLIIILILCISGSSSAETTFLVDKVVPAKKLLSDYPAANAVKYSFGRNALASSANDGYLICGGIHPLIETLSLAYADHRPVILSPDIIWLTLIEGFSSHINRDPEKYRNLIVNFKDKKKLEILLDHYDKNDLQYWNKAIAAFCTEINKNVSAGFTGILTADFTTTTEIERTAYQVVLMEVVKEYFDYNMGITCGITKITLEGTPQDWQKILDKVQGFRKYDLGWWVDELEPILKEFVKASKGRADPEFWQSIFKYHTAMCGESDKVSGWIIKLFPYIGKGDKYKNTDTERLLTPENLTEIYLPTGLNKQDRYKNPAMGIPISVSAITEVHKDDFPQGIAQVDVLLKNNCGDKKEENIQFIAGFIGIEQNHTTFALKPKIGWVVRENQQSAAMAQEAASPKNTSSTHR